LLDHESRAIAPFSTPLLKWIGSKQRYASQIAYYFPPRFGTYYEPFLGSGGVLATLYPEKAIGSDIFAPLIEIWKTLHDNPQKLKDWYTERWHIMKSAERVAGYEKIKASYNASPNGADLLFLCRSCYGGVVRFRQKDGYMSTPCGPHDPIPPQKFAQRVEEWHRRTEGTEFILSDYKEIMEMAKPGDLIYCDPPYSHSQTILYGAQTFILEELFESIERCKSRGVYVVLSIDGTKRSGKVECEIPLPKRLFECEIFVNCGRSMLKRFQMDGKTLEGENVSDRLLLTYG
jgi:DNA adenine methylase